MEIQSYRTLFTNYITKITFDFFVIASCMQDDRAVKIS